MLSYKAGAPSKTRGRTDALILNLNCRDPFDARPTAHHVYFPLHIYRRK